MDPRKRDLTPSVLDFGPVRFKIARHFGFCYGVENAIEIAYRALEEHPEKAAEGRIFLLSEMIHNPYVNDDLQRRGIRFLRTTAGEQLIPFSELHPGDVVIIPAFGTTLEVEAQLAERGVVPAAYDTTCPFVEKVWKKSAQIGKKQYTIVVHGKRYHEETRATISHARQDAPVVVVRDLEEAENLARVVRGEASSDFFFERFADRYSEGFESRARPPEDRRGEPDDDAGERDAGHRRLAPRSDAGALRRRRPPRPLRRHEATHSATRPTRTRTLRSA